MLPFPIPGKAIAIIAIVLFIGGTIYAGYRYVDNLQQAVIDLNVENGTLTSANDKLTKQIEALKLVQKDIEKERDSAQESDITAREMVRTLELTINDKARQKRIEDIESSKKASLFLRYTTKFENCLALHFDDFTGECNFRGKFKPYEATVEVTQ